LTATVDGARRIMRIGQFVSVIGGLVGLVVWLGVFSGDATHNGMLIFILPMGAGAAITGVGMILDRTAKSA